MRAKSDLLRGIYSNDGFQFRMKVAKIDTPTAQVTTVSNSFEPLAMDAKSSDQLDSDTLPAIASTTSDHNLSS